MHDNHLNQIHAGIRGRRLFRRRAARPRSPEGLAEREELADAVSGLADSYARPPPGDDPLAPLAREVARALTEAGFTLHQCV
jgi:hypothetical protein